jgi:hypothetical protein
MRRGSDVMKEAPPARTFGPEVPPSGLFVYDEPVDRSVENPRTREAPLY